MHPWQVAISNWHHRQLLATFIYTLPGLKSAEEIMLGHEQLTGLLLEWYDALRLAQCSEIIDLYENTPESLWMLSTRKPERWT